MVVVYLINNLFKSQLLFGKHENTYEVFESIDPWSFSVMKVFFEEWKKLFGFMLIIDHIHKK